MGREMRKEEATCIHKSNHNLEIMCLELMCVNVLKGQWNSFFLWSDDTKEDKK